MNLEHFCTIRPNPWPVGVLIWQSTGNELWWLEIEEPARLLGPIHFCPFCGERLT